VPTKALLYCAGGGVGDSLMATVVARALRARYQRVDALTLPGHRAALERVPDIDDVLIDEGQPEADLANALAALRYDAAVVTWATPRTARIPYHARIPIRVGQARRLYSWRFTHRVIVRSENGDVTSHWSQILLDYARAIGCDTLDTAPAFVPAADDENEAQALLERHGLSNTRFAIVHATNAIAPERGLWPTQGWSALARGLQDRFGVRVLLSGVASDAEIVSRIAAESGALSIAGETSLGGFGALARRALAFAGITTGSMHIAAAVGCPTVGIFPFQTDTPERWAPVGRCTAVVRATFPCRPGERKETCPDYACIAHLNVRQILAALQQLLGTMVR
jgi:ADP-heptose:LPS heptosyltransferase